MKLSKKPCRIIGVRVGEISSNLLNPDAGTLGVKFVLFGEDGQNYGSYTRTTWSPETMEAFQKFIDSMENDALLAMFDDQSQLEVTAPAVSLSFPPVPILGGTKRNDPP